MTEQEVAMTADAMRSRAHPAGSSWHARNWPFRLKLALAMLGLCLAPAALAIAVLTWRAGALASDRQSAIQRQRAQVAAAYLGAILNGDVRVVGGVAGSDPALELVNDPGLAIGNQRIQQYRLQPLLGAAAAAVPALANGTLYIATSGGTILDATRPALVQSSSGGSPAVQLAVAGKAPVVMLEPALGSTGTALVAAAPIMRGAFAVGAVVGEFDPTSLYDALGLVAGSLQLVDGRIVAGRTAPAGAPALLLGSSPVASQPSGVPALAAPHSGQPLALADGSWAVAIPNASSVLVVAPLPAQPFLLSSAPVPALLALLALVAVAAALILAALLGRPLVKLARTLVAVRAGNYGLRVHLRQRDEVGQVADTVDLLVARAQALVTDLENQRVELETGIIQLFTELAEAASGDLTVRPTLSEGSLGAVADSVSILLERFNATVKRIQATASAVSSGSSQMAATVLRVSQEARAQATQLASGASAITEMAASAQSVSQRTQAATDVAAQAVDAVESGNTAVTYAREAVKRTSETAKKAARQVKSLGESTQLMGNALLLVQRNTEELHLIAGNASIEAARYAENGGVFRTVADSIEQLAQQSQVALRQIQSVVENTQRETSRVVSAIEDVTGEVTHVSKAISLAGENFDTINQVVQRLADLNLFIASASEQQATMAADVAHVIGALNQVSVQTSMNTAASAEAAVRLRQLTEQLNDSVSTLKVS